MTNSSARTAPSDVEDTRQQILDAAVEVFSSKGYHDARVDDIVHESGKSKGGVYFHFRSKQEIFLAIIDRFAEILAQGFIDAISAEDDGIRRVNAALVMVVDTFSKYRRLAKIFLIQASGLGDTFEQKRLEINKRFADVIASHLDQAVSEGDIPAIDTEVAALVWMGAINEVIIRWVHTGSPEPDRILKTLRVMLLRSIHVSDDRIRQLEDEIES